MTAPPAGRMAGSVLPRAGRRVGQEQLPRTTAGACTGSFMSGLLSRGPEGKRCADGFGLGDAGTPAGEFAATIPSRLAGSGVLAAIARTIRALAYVEVVVALK